MAYANYALGPSHSMNPQARLVRPLAQSPMARQSLGMAQGSGSPVDGGYNWNTRSFPPPGGSSVDGGYNWGTRSFKPQMGRLDPAIMAAMQARMGAPQPLQQAPVPQPLQGQPQDTSQAAQLPLLALAKIMSGNANPISPNHVIWTGGGNGIGTIRRPPPVPKPQDVRMQMVQLAHGLAKQLAQNHGHTLRRNQRGG